MTRRAAFLVGAIGAAACVDVPPPSCDDQDSDGWSCGASAPDCNEDDDQVHPGAIEICGDGIDDDCSGADLPCADAIQPLDTTVDSERIEVRLDESVGDQRDFVVELDGDHGYTMTSLIQASSEILYDEADALRGAGIALLPDAAQWQATPGYVDPDTLSGPALLHHTTRWELAGTDIDGYAHVTVFPDGRIHRSDRVTLGSAIAGTTLSSYASFDENFDTITWGGLDGTITVEPGYRRELGVGETGWLCAFDSFFAHRGVLLWAADPDHPAAPTIDTGLNRFTLSYDWLRGVATLPAGTYRARTMLLARQVYLGSDPEIACDVEAELAQLEAPAPLIVHIGAPYDEDVVEGDGYDADVGIYAVTGGDNGDHVEVEIGAGGIPGPGFGILVELYASEIAVWRDGVRLEHGRDYLAHVDDPNDYYSTHYLYVKRPDEGIAAGTRFWIAGPGAEP